MITADACSMILLAKATVLEELAKRRKLVISPAVYGEIMQGKGERLFDALLTERLVAEKKISIQKIPPRKMMEKLAKDFGLGEGESETLSITLANPGSMILTDNRQGRKTAKVYGLPLAGSIEVVVAMYKLKQIQKEKALSALHILQQSGWFDKALIVQATQEVSNE